MFIEELKFNEDFPPFEKETIIKFWWEKEVQNLINFYLKNKKDSKKNAERFKINCIVWNNGAGKSTIFNRINGFLNWQFWTEFIMELTLWCHIIKRELNLANYIYDDIDSNKIKPLAKFKNIWLIIDDFFVWSKLIKDSVNKDVLFGFTNFNTNPKKFYLNIHDFFKNENSKNIFYKFLNLEKEYNLSLDFKINEDYIFNLKSNNEQIKNKEQYNLDLINKLKEFLILIKSNIWEDYKILFKYSIFYILVLIDDFLSEYYKLRVRKNITEEILKEPIIKDLFELLIYYNNTFNVFLWENDIISFLENYDDKNINSFLNKNEVIWNNVKNKIYLSIEKYLWSEYNNIDNKKILSIKFDSKYKDIITNLNFINCDLTFSDKNTTKSFESLSWWEKTMLIRFTNIYMQILKEVETWKKDFIILIDEPDLHLHLDWQRQYIQKLIDVFSTLDTNIHLHFIIATHSPFIISDLPSKSLVLLKKDENKKYVDILNFDWNSQEEKLKSNSFWANYIDLIRNWFFFQDKMLMWSFAKEIIWDVAKVKRFETLKWHINIESLNEKDKNIYSNFVENKIYWDDFLEKIEENIWDDFLRDNLLYFKPEKNDKS